MLGRSRGTWGWRPKKTGEKGRRQVWDKDNKVMQGRSQELGRGIVRGPARGSPQEARVGSEHHEVGGGEAWGTKAPSADELTKMASWARGIGGLGQGYVKRTLSGPPLPLEVSPGACMLVCVCVCVCASQYLPLGVCVPAFLPSCTPASTHMCVHPLHGVVSHQLT